MIDICLFSCFQFVSKSVDEVDSEEWVRSLGTEMAKQISLYTNFPEEKVVYVLHSHQRSEFFFTFFRHR